MNEKPPTTDPEQRRRDTEASRRQSGLPPEPPPQPRREPKRAPSTGRGSSPKTEPEQS